MSGIIVIAFVDISVVVHGVLVRLIVLLLLFLFHLEHVLVLDHVIPCQPHVLVESKLLHGCNDVIALYSTPLCVSTDLTRLTSHKQQKFSDAFLHGFLSFLRYFASLILITDKVY